MITRTQSFQTSDGQFWPSIDAAQIHELSVLIDATPAADMALFLHKNRDKVIDILTTTVRSKTRARGINGGTKRRTPRIAIATGPAPVEGKPSTPAGTQA